MCGIAGFIGDGDRALLERMLKALVHRGPDDAGTWIAPGVALGMRRLSIIDLPGGHQPMANEDETLRVVFNGEIYNFRELRSDLPTRGHRFRTCSDTEVILHAYEQYGAACVEHLRGMFAFALWDGPRRTLLLARDRLGKKPLYYWQAGGLFLFASEIKALLEHPAVAREVDAVALGHYLAFGYTPRDRSILRDIRKLPPAHTMTVGEGGAALRPYWDLAAVVRDAAGPRARPWPELLEATRAHVEDAVRARLVSDVPLGVFLSGGVDSAAVVAAMRRVAAGPIRTFSIGYGPEAGSFNELAEARATARHFQTEHHEEVLSPRIADLLPHLVAAFDEPFADSSALPTFLVAQAARSRVTVALSGIGGDEAFAGYPRYLGARLSLAYARLPRPFRRAGAAALPALVPETMRSRNWGSWARRFAAGGLVPFPERYLRWTAFLDPEAQASLLAPEMLAAARRAWDAADGRAALAVCPDDPLAGMFLADTTTYLIDDLLTMADRMTMAHSLELRAPFCDHPLVEFAAAIPPALRLRGLRLKGLLKAALAPWIPREILHRPKRGFMVPLGQWLQRDLAPLLEEYLGPEALRRRGWFRPEGVAALRRAHAEGRRNAADPLWALVVLEAWQRQYLDGRGA